LADEDGMDHEPELVEELVLQQRPPTGAASPAACPNYRPFVYRRYRYSACFLPGW
jgi:hypothetical protein